MGKSSIVYVIGLSLIIGIALANINETSMGSMDSYTTYFGRTMAHNIALAHEKRGDLEGADEWIDRALDDISGVGVKQYRKVLNVRLEEEPILIRQLEEWEAATAAH